MLSMFGRAVQLGAGSVPLVRGSDHTASVVVGLCYVLMFLVLAYVDIVCDARSTVVSGLAIALCADFVPRHIDADRRPLPALGLAPQ